MSDKARLPRWVLALIAFFGALLVALAALVVLALLPTDLERLRDEVPAFVDQTRRRPLEGCPLTERVVDEGCAPLETGGARTLEVSFKTTTAHGPRELRGTLHLPAAAGPRPAVVLVHGSGPATRDEEVPGDLLVRLDPPLKVFEALARHLSEELGFAVLRYDKRTCRACYPELDEGYLARFSFLHFARDAEAALDFLGARPEVEARNLVVVGHSQGAAFLPEILEGRDDVVAAVWLAGFSGAFSEAVLGQLDAFASIRTGQHDHLGAFTARMSRRALAGCFEKLEGPDFDPDEVCIGGGVRQAALKEYEELTRRTRARLDELEVPALFVQGTLDRNAPARELVELRDSLRGDVELRVGLRGDVELRSLAGVTHALTQERTPALAAGVLSSLDAFFASVGQRGPTSSKGVSE